MICATRSLNCFCFDFWIFIQGMLIFFGYTWQPVICKYAGARNSNTVFITNYLNYSIVVMYQLNRSNNTTHHDFHLGRFFAVLGPTHYRIMYVRGFQIDDT